MSWFSKLFSSSDEEEEDIVCVPAKTDEESLQLGIQALEERHPEEKDHPKDFYCGLCAGEDRPNGGWVPVELFRLHGHPKR
jgi:hypothetical protein